MIFLCDFVKRVFISGKVHLSGFKLPFRTKACAIVQCFKFHSKIRHQGAVWCFTGRHDMRQTGVWHKQWLHSDRFAIWGRWQAHMARAVELATSLEMAAKDVTELQQTVDWPVNTVQPVAFTCLYWWWMAGSKGLQTTSLRIQVSVTTVARGVI